MGKIFRELRQKSAFFAMKNEKKFDWLEEMWEANR